jgi:protein TonB
MDPSKRFPTLVLATGVLVLLLAIALGERMGDRILVQAADSGLSNATVIVTPLPPGATPEPYGANWRSSQTLAAVPDPGFPDPRVPPKPLPTPIPQPTERPVPKWTPNPNIPIWDQTPPPTPSANP